MAGHVFITHSDITELYCDSWLMSCDVVPHVSRWFYRQIAKRGLYPGLAEVLHDLEDHKLPRPPGWSHHDGTRVISLLSWHNALSGRAKPPIPYLVNVGGIGEEKPEWYAEGARQFCVKAREELNDENRLTKKRSKPLVALPFVGVRGGRGGERRGAILRALLLQLDQCARECDIDIALVLSSRGSFIAAEKVRRELTGEMAQSTAWPELSQELRKSADDLANHARNESLVLFLGSGVSIGAGLPSWGELLASLAADAGFTPLEIEAIKKLHLLDQAAIIEHRIALGAPDGDAILGEKVANLLDFHFHSLSHSLLAGLPVREAVTLNYDRLFEQACDAQKDPESEPIAVLPYKPARNARRWLLKLHGCVDHPEDIVLTREDYLRYTDRRAALFGLVQGLLMTRHMLFVGFGLKDDNFHRIVDDVRKAMGPHKNQTSNPEDRLGTAIVFSSDDLHKTLFEGELDFVDLHVGEEKGFEKRARLLEIFLDYLLSEASKAPPPLLNPTFDAVLTDEEKKLRELLLPLQDQAFTVKKSSPVWEPIRQLLRSYGARPEKAGADQIRARNTQSR